MKVHDVVRVQRGRYAGDVGVVLAVKPEGSAKVEIEGVRDGRPFVVARWFALDNLGANRGN